MLHKARSAFCIGEHRGRAHGKSSESEMMQGNNSLCCERNPLTVY
jgi:hypothetical protein